MGRPRSDVESLVMASVLPRDLADKVKADAEASGQTWSRHIRHIIEAYYAELGARTSQAS